MQVSLANWKGSIGKLAARSVLPCALTRLHPQNMKLTSAITGLSFLVAGSLGAHAQSLGLGLKFASTDPDAATSSLLPTEVAGVVPQANWNNLTGATGTNTALVYNNSGTATPSSV